MTPPVPATPQGGRLTVFTSAAPRPASAGTVIRVLVVEDSAVDAELMAGYLASHTGDESASFTMRRVASLGDARCVLEDEAVDVILLDLSLPDATGRESLDALLERSPDVPIVVMTGRADDALAAEAVRAGAQDYLVKGREDRRAVRRAVHHAVERQRLVCQARQAARARDETLAIVSHDLRNALGAIEACVQALRDGAAASPERMRRSLDIAERSTGWMSRLIQDLLDVSRMEAGQLSMHPEPVPANALVATLVTAHMATAAERKVTLSARPAPEAPWIHVDPDRLFQALANVVENAIKFTSRGGQVVVSVSAPADADGFVRIAVSDTGCGIEPEQLAHVFDRFWQARHARRGGAGLGLAIAKGIIEAHGGTIAVESVVGAGTTFTCRVPVAEPTPR